MKSDVQQYSKILLVDDRPANLVAMETILKSLKVSLFKANSGEEALSLLVRHRFALILLDVQMPGLDGFETAGLIRQSEEGETVPIIFVTAIDKDDRYVIKGYDTGAVDYLFKPIDHLQLKSKVKVFLELDQQKIGLKTLLEKKEELLNSVLTAENKNERSQQLIKQIKEQNAKLKVQSRLWVASSFLAVLAAGFVFYNFWISRENTRLGDINEQITCLNKAYKRFIPHEFVSLLGKDGIEKVGLGNQILQAMSVMFFDVVGFTTMTEQMSAEESIALMNEIFAMVQPVIAKNNGIINKYLGDGAMVIFPGGENDAVTAATDMINVMANLSKKRVKNGLKPVSLGVGIDSGPLMAGTVGEEKRMEFTVYGKTVNLASRIEGLTRKYGVDLLITENVYSRISGKNRKNIRVVDNVRVKGKKGVVTIYEVFRADNLCRVATHRKALPDYVNGFNLYRKGKFKQAIASFKKVSQINPADNLAKYHLEKCQQLVKTDRKNWSPVETFVSK